MMHKKLFNLLRVSIVFAVLFSTLLFPSILYSADTAVVSVSTLDQTIEPGETFTVDITVDPNNAIAGMQFDLSFNPSLLAANSINEGDLLSQDGADTYFDSGNVNNSTGTITNVFSVIISPGETISATGTFATITFTGKTRGGTCPLTLSNVIIGDIEGQSVPINVNNGVVYINSHPVISMMDNKIGNEGEFLLFTISASDANSDVLYYAAYNLPTGAVFDTYTQVFSWKPSYRQAGIYYDVCFEVSDGNLVDTENITIFINNVYQPDVSNDGFINILDLIITVQHWGEVGPNSWIPEDINEDGIINVLDAILIGQYWTE